MRNLFSRALPVCLGVAAAGLLASSASATVKITSVGMDTPGYRIGTVKFGNVFSVNADIGRIKLTGVNAKNKKFSTRTYCIDIFDVLRTGTFAEGVFPKGKLATTKQKQLSTLLAHVDPLSTSRKSLVTNATTSAAVQLAVWEIVTETSKTYDVTSGMFSVAVNKAYGTTNTLGLIAAQKQANQWLAMLPAWDKAGSYNLTLRTLTSKGNQTQIGAAVPESSTWAMLIVGFGAIGGAMRRRRKVSVAFA